MVSAKDLTINMKLTARSPTNKKSCLGESHSLEPKAAQEDGFLKRGPSEDEVTELNAIIQTDLKR